MERMVNERLVWWAEQYQKLAQDQNGFRRGRLCTDNLNKITADIRIDMYQGEYTLAAFLDVSSAYDNVNYGILLDKLKQLGCPKYIRRFIGS